ncbi:MAG: hypothetical protein QXV22_02650 [Thermoplasmataceae archaeon]
MPDTKVVLDTNALIYSIKGKVDIEKWLSITIPWNSVVVPSSVINELESLSSRIPEARGALRLCQNFELLPVKSSGDDGIIEAAANTQGIVLTNDRQLVRKLRSLGIRTFSISKNKRVVLTR